MKTDKRTVRTARTGKPDRVPLPSSLSPSASASYRGVFPNSSKVYLEGPQGIRVPVREIALAGGEPPLRVYDTSGPEGHDVRKGLPPLRRSWIRVRDVDETTPASVLRGRSPITQLHYARRGELTPEMEFVALREGCRPRSCAAR